MWCVVHDYSEGYACWQQDEIQSEYFDVAKVSLHVTILHRHAVEEVDGVARTEENPRLVKDHIFVISDDPVQDYDSVHKNSRVDLRLLDHYCSL